ncbi:MAG: hypothetical protein ACE5G1_08880 [bacterium]
MIVWGTHLFVSHLMLGYTAVWVVATIGILKMKKWGWAFLMCLALFSFVVTANLLLMPDMGRLDLPVFVACTSGLIFVVLLNLSTVHVVYKTNIVKSQTIPGHLSTFAVVCMSVGIFIFFELFTGFRIAPGTIIVKLFVSGIGLVFTILGAGIWRINRAALQSIEPVLIFTLASLAFILVKDYADGTRTFQVVKSIFYLSLVAGVTLYWFSKVRPKVSRDSF